MWGEGTNLLLARFIVEILKEPHHSLTVSSRSPRLALPMENEASKTRSMDIAFLVDSETLTGLEKLLCEVKGALEYKVKFSDGSMVKYDDIVDVIGQPNSNKRFIVSILASAEGHAGHSAFLTMRNDPEPSVEYTISGSQRNVIYFADKLDDWIASSRQWYSAFFSSRLGALAALAALALPLFLANKSEILYPAGKSWLPLTTMIVVGLAEYWTFKLFPRATFALGHGARRHQLFSYIRNTVLAGFAISVLASVFANWLTKHL